MCAMKRLCISVAAFVGMLQCAAQPADTLVTGIQERLLRSLSCGERFYGMIYDNPAVQYDRCGYSLTDVVVEGVYRKENEALFPQEGDGHDGFSFSADSYIRRPKFVLWGNAAYENTRIRNVRWNETSDWQLLYPYLMADPVGGDMNKEAYSFAGGYAGRKERWAWGLEFAYDASVAYRGVDPRPKNVTSMLTLSIGGSCQVGDSYAVDVSVAGEKYKQSNELKFYSESGASKVYHLTGLGLHYVRFAGDNCDTYYKGYRWTGSLGVHSLGGGGWSGVAQFRYFSFGKIISSLNELPMADADEYAVKAEVGYKAVAAANDVWGVKLEGEYVDRKGTENIFGDASSAVYPQIASARRYGSVSWRCVLSGFYEGEVLKRLSYGVQPRMCCRSVEARYEYPSRRVAARRLDAGMSFYLAYLFGRSLLRFEAAASYDATLNSSFKADMSGDEEEALFALLEHNYRSLKSGCAGMQLGASYGYGFARNYMLRIKLGWQRGWYDAGVRADYAAASLAFCF